MVITMRRVWMHIVTGGEPFHMERYLDEQMFRFNNRIGHTDGTRFQKALAQVGGKRLTWVELTGKESKKVA